VRGAWLGLLACACSAPAPASFQACDVQTPACQQQTYRAVAERRGQLWDPWTLPPPVRRLTPDGLLRRLDAQATGRYDGWITTLHQLDLLADGLAVIDADELWSIDHVAVRYWPAQGDVTIVDRGAPLAPGEAVALLADGYVHAAQDHELGLQPISVLTTEHELIRNTLFEGEGQLLAELARAELRGQAPEALDWNALFDARLAAVRAQTFLTESPHTLVRLALPPALGGRWMAQAWLRGRDVGVDEAFLRPPPSFQALMQAASGGGPTPTVAARCALSLDRAVFSAQERDVLGAGMLYAYLTRLSAQEPEAWTSALTWAGDELWTIVDRARAKGVTLWRVHAPGLGQSPLGPLLAARPGPPVLEGDDLWVWSPEDTDAVAAIRRGLVCP
jgi:hypothetical protein